MLIRFSDQLQHQFLRIWSNVLPGINLCRNVHNLRERHLFAKFSFRTFVFVICLAPKGSTRFAHATNTQTAIEIQVTEFDKFHKEINACENIWEIHLTMHERNACENIWEIRGHRKVDSPQARVTVDFFLTRQSTHCRHIQC